MTVPSSLSQAAVYKLPAKWSELAPQWLGQIHSFLADPLTLLDMQLVCKNWQKIPCYTEHLSVSGRRITDKQLERALEIINTKKLKSVDISFCKHLTPRVLDYFENLNISELNVSWTFVVKDVELSAIAQLPLTSLKMAGKKTIINSKQFKILQPLKLEKLSIAHTESNSVDDYFKFAPKTLTSLDMSGLENAATSDNLRHLKETALTSLNLSNCGGVAVEQLKDLPLTELNLSGAKRLEPKAYKVLASLPLSTLILSWSNVTDECLEELGESRTIQVLDLSGNDEITDEGIVYLHEVSLRALSLFRCSKISKEGLLTLNDTLRFLDLRGCEQIPSTHIAQLRELMPKVDVRRGMESPVLQPSKKHVKMDLPPLDLSKIKPRKKEEVDLASRLQPLTLEGISRGMLPAPKSGVVPVKSPESAASSSSRGGSPVRARLRNPSESSQEDN